MFSDLSDLVRHKYDDHDALKALVNDALDDDTDYEHLITFLDQSPSALHRCFATDARNIFEEVLTRRLKQVQAEQGETPDELYFGLLDFHSVVGVPEVLQGFLTLNYDQYLEHAIARSPIHSLDPGINIDSPPGNGRPVRVLKLHGWLESINGWPISSRENLGKSVWIPPGIQKAKERYPFNLLWGLARELLDCDVLRIIGCNLGANDWDLISLLFTTRHATGRHEPYRVEMIDSPGQARRLQSQFPYLDIRSLFQLESIGKDIIAECGGDPKKSFEELSPKEQDMVIREAGSRNWFWMWLKHKAEAAFKDVETLTTRLGSIEHLLRAY